MSLLEKSPTPGRLLLDDTLPLTALIEASQNLQSHTVSAYLDWPASSVWRRSEAYLGPRFDVSEELLKRGVVAGTTIGLRCVSVTEGFDLQIKRSCKIPVYNFKA